MTETFTSQKSPYLQVNPAIEAYDKLYFIKSFSLDQKHVNAKIILLAIKIKGNLRIKLSFLIKMGSLIPLL